MATKKINSSQVVEHDVEDENTENVSAKTLDTKGEDDYTVPLDVTLSNGVELTLDVIKDQGDWDYAAVEAMSEMNYPVLVNAILTRASKLKLKMAGARVRDFETITDKVSEAIGTIKGESAAEKKK